MGGEGGYRLVWVWGYGLSLEYERWERLLPRLGAGIRLYGEISLRASLRHEHFGGYGLVWVLGNSLEGKVVHHS